MIYSCRACGRSFSAEELNKALKDNGLICCKYCGNSTQVSEMRTSLTALGYNELARAKFTDAHNYFNRAVEEIENRLRTHSYSNANEALINAYLGRALAEFNVQTVYREDDPDKLEPPRLICHKYDRRYFSENVDYKHALRMAEHVSDEETVRKDLFRRISSFAETVDGIKEEYEMISEERFGQKNYSLFLAIEDEPVRGEKFDGYEKATKVADGLSTIDSLGDVFLPDPQNHTEENDLHYEAEILYAIDHSNCMLVLTDDHIATRLNNLYTRFFYAKRQNADRIAFILYRSDTRPILPENRTPVMFRIEDERGWDGFYLRCNNIAQIPLPGPNKPGDDEGSDTGGDNPVITPQDALSLEPDGKTLLFGSYPQGAVESSNITFEFESMGKPKVGSDNGWTPLYRNAAKNETVAWYRDAEIENKKYRAVYFIASRSPVSNGAAGTGKEQIKHGYTASKIYCFKFAPIRWELLRRNDRLGFFVSRLALDCAPYNENSDSADWEESTLCDWLNKDFLETAFTKEERELLGGMVGHAAEERIFLLDTKQDKEYYSSRAPHKAGSDYLRCVGGMSDKNTLTVDSYWAIETAYHGEMPGSMSVIIGNSVSERSVYSTTVSVVPKIIVPLK